MTSMAAIYSEPEESNLYFYLGEGWGGGGGGRGEKPGYFVAFCCILFCFFFHHCKSHFRFLFFKPSKINKILLLPWDSS